MYPFPHHHHTAVRARSDLAILRGDVGRADALLALPAAKRKKVNIYVTETGLPKHPHGWAYGGRDLVVDPGAMLEGSSVVPHEFGHVLQSHLGGFTGHQIVGWIWESHANWCAHQFIPSAPMTLEWWHARCHYELASTRHNYGSWLFLQTMREDPRYPADACFQFWVTSARAADPQRGATEDVFTSLMRYCVEAGIWEGDGVDGLGALVGDMARRMVTMDFVLSRTYLLVRTVGATVTLASNRS